MIYHSETKTSRRDRAAVHRVLKSGIVNDSHITGQLEEQWSKMNTHVTAKAVGSGTRAIVHALESFSVGPQTPVFTSSYVCEDIDLAIRSLGAQAIYCDISSRDFNLDFNDLQRRVNNSTDSPAASLPGVVLVPHLFGAPADIKQIRGLNLPIIEDVTHALGGLHHEGPIGSLGDCSITSLHALKVVTAGEGGLVSWAGGRVSESSQAGDHLSNINSALALSQFSRLDKIVSRRRLIAEAYKDELAPHFELGIHVQEELHGTSTRFRFVVLLPEGMNVDVVRQRLLHDGIVAQRPVKNLLRNERNAHGKAENPNAERVFDSAISLPIHGGISPRMARKVARRFIHVVEIFLNAEESHSFRFPGAAAPGTSLQM